MLDASGVGAYLKGILPFLIQSEHSFLLLGNTERLKCYASYLNVTVVPCDLKPFSLKALFFFPSGTIRRINQTDVFFSPFFNIPPVNIPVFTTIHDIIFPDMPELTGRIALAARMYLYKKAYKISKKIFTVSEFSRSRIEHYLGKKKPVIVTNSAVQNKFYEYRKNNPHIQKTQTVVFIGNIKKHKGLDCLIDAFVSAKEEGLPHKLVIIGEKEKFRSNGNSVLKKINLLCEDSVSFSGYISDEQLMEHLAKAALLVQPSLYEGFGLPPLEAMVLGTYALVSDIPVFKEIYGGFPVSFFSAGDCGELKNKLKELLLDKTPPLPILPDDLLYKYSFKKIAAKILKEFE